MNAAHLHLLINHLPVFLIVASVFVLLWGMYTRNDGVQKVALFGFLLAGLSVLAVVQSGEEAEEIVEEIASVSHDTIEDHEEAAELSKWLTIVLGIGGIAGLAMARIRARKLRSLLWSIAVFGVITAISLAYTGYLGGQIRHAEEINQKVTSETGQTDYDE
ncbi:MAG: hypothetical protein R3281_11955 [Balneolaceae bacterium]|nr:hypothetical protein [Balneolaceae bacterium]